MTIGFFILTVLLIAILSAIIYALKWSLGNVLFSENPKIQRIAEIIVKVLIVVFSAVLAYVIFGSLMILISPLFDQLNNAFSVAVSKIFAFLDQFIPWVVLGGIGYGYWKNRKTKSSEDGDDKNDPVEMEYAEQEAEELHGDLGELIFNATVDTSQNTPLQRPRDAASIETGKEKPYRSDGIMMVHQFSVDTDTPLDRAGEDLVLRELQRHTNQRGKRYPQLCRDGLPPIIFDIKNNGNFIIVEVVLYSDKYKGKIEARRKARIARQQRQDEGDAGDPLFR